MFDLNHFNAVLLDMDGVLYRGQTPLPGVNEMLAFFEQRGITYACVTNNSTLTPEQYEAKLKAMGIAIPAARVITSSTATRQYLEGQAPRGTTVYYIGEQGLHDALFSDGYFVYDEQHPQIVVAGLDHQVTYTKFKIATLAIRAGARFIGTNPDLTLPTQEGLTPGAGSIQAMIQAATDSVPVVIGKPEPTMLTAAITILHADPDRTLVVGDRLDTDIAGAKAAKLASLLVLTGVSSAEDLKKSEIQPSATYAGLPEMIAAWK